jgi:hypothetical protein
MRIEDDLLEKAIDIWDNGEFLTSVSLPYFDISAYKKESRFYLMIYSKNEGLSEVQEVTKSVVANIFKDTDID